MRNVGLVGSGILLLAAFVTGLSFSQAPTAGGDGGRNRGRYLVEEVGKCGECHTPKDVQGRWDDTRRLMGAPVWFRPIREMPDWAYYAPRLAGLPNFQDEQVRTVLEKGIGPNGLSIRPPMHVYHMSPEDAGAIIAYLRSVRGGS